MHEQGPVKMVDRNKPPLLACESSRYKQLLSIMRGWKSRDAASCIVASFVADQGFSFMNDLLLLHRDWELAHNRWAVVNIRYMHVHCARPAKSATKRYHYSRCGWNLVSCEWIW